MRDFRDSMVITPSTDPARRRALIALCANTGTPAQPTMADVEVVTSAGDVAWQDVGRVVIDGALARWRLEDVDRLHSVINDGASALVVVATVGDRPADASPGSTGVREAWEAMLGVDVGRAEPTGEVLAVPVAHPATARMPGTFAVTDRMHPLTPTADDVVSIVGCSVRYRERQLVVARPLGRGHVVSTGLGCRTDALVHPQVRTVLRRALRLPRGQEPAQAPVGVGVVGYGPYGGMGWRHGTAAAAVEGLAFVAAVDADPSRRKAAEADFPGVSVYSDVDELLADDAVGLVVVATPPVSHADIALRALESGRHVVVEKPLCLTTAQADSLIACARAHRRMLTVHQNRRWDPDFLSLRQAVETGLLGEVFNVETFVGGFAHPCRAWHSEVSVSGGAVYDWGSHHLDWILELMGELPRTVTTTAHKRVWHDVTNLDQIRVRLQWDDGREAEFFQSDIAAVRRPKFYVQGTQGTLVGHYRPLVTERVDAVAGYNLESHHHAEAPVELTLARYEAGWGVIERTLPPIATMSTMSTMSTVAAEPDQAFAFHRNVADHLHLGEPLAISPEGARRVVALLEAAKQSSDRGGATIDLHDAEEPS